MSGGALGAEGMDEKLGRRIVALSQRIVSHFDLGNWTEVGLLTGTSRTIDTYPRLLRSLDWGDSDYSGNAMGVLRMIAEQNPSAFEKIEQYVEERFPDQSAEYVSARPAERTITFSPNVFSVPDVSVQPDLVSVMMPMNREFTDVYRALQRACDGVGLRCMRADDIWEDSVIVQDIFTLVFQSQIVIVDFSGRNSNVMYETGIAHTLGKNVVPISQSLDDVPFDLRHHRVLRYLANEEGLTELQSKLSSRLRRLVGIPEESDDEVPF